MLKQLIQFRSQDNAIHLTFDDGPHPDFTPRILELLAAFDAKATFFVVGHQVEKYPAIIERMCAEGHTIANHTLTHPSLLFKRRGFIRNEIDETDRLIEAIAGSKPQLFRPPHGRFGLNLLRTIKKTNHRMILWNCSAKDYSPKSNTRSICDVILKAYPGSIVLLHDGHQNSGTTIAGLKKALNSGLTFPLKALK